MKIQKVETTYHVNLNVSDYDSLEVIQATDSRITIKFLEQRWRTIDETVKMLKEVIKNLKTLK